MTEQQIHDYIQARITDMQRKLVTDLYQHFDATNDMLNRLGGYSLMEQNAEFNRVALMLRDQHLAMAARLETALNQMKIDQ